MICTYNTEDICDTVVHKDSKIQFDITE